jgi:hypothetical protein
MKKFADIKFSIRGKPITFLGTWKKDIYILPNGTEAFVEKSIKESLLKGFGPANKQDMAFILADLSIKINAAPSGEKMVMVKRVGKGATEKSAKYRATITQTVDGVKAGTREVDFTLPVSQVEDMGDGFAAPEWLITKKLAEKKETAWGKRYRDANGIDDEVASAEISSKKCHSKSAALTDWLEQYIKAETEATAKQREEKKVAEEEWKQMLSRLDVVVDALFLQINEQVKSDSSAKPLSLIYKAGADFGRESLSHELPEKLEFQKSYLVRQLKFKILGIK